MTRQRTHLRKKYPDLKEGLPKTPEQQLSASDTKELARLVSKYGQDTIVAAAKEAPLSRRGRPPRGDLPYYERMHWADWVEERVEEYIQADSPKPVKKALIDAYDMLYEGEHDPPDLQKFLKTHKKKFHIGRRELQEVREAQRRKQEWLQKRKKGRN